MNIKGTKPGDKEISCAISGNLQSFTEKIEQDKNHILVENLKNSGKLFITKIIQNKILRDNQPLAIVVDDVQNAEFYKQFGCGEVSTLGEEDFSIIPAVLERARGGILFLEEVTALSKDAQKEVNRNDLSRPKEGLGASHPEVIVIGATCNDLNSAVKEKTLSQEFCEFFEVIDAAEYIADSEPLCPLFPAIEYFLSRQITPLDETSLEEILNYRLEKFLGMLENYQVANIYNLVIGYVEKSLLKIALNQTRGNKFQAAKLLGINRNTLHAKMQKHDVKVEG
jgi:Fis family transcriptional regulator